MAGLGIKVTKPRSSPIDRLKTAPERLERALSITMRDIAMDAKRAAKVGALSAQFEVDGYGVSARRTANARKVRRAGRRGLRVLVANTMTIKRRSRRGALTYTVFPHGGKMPAGMEGIPSHMTAGGWRHPVFGEDAWVAQRVTNDWFFGSVRKGTARAKADLRAAIRKAVR